MKRSGFWTLPTNSMFSISLLLKGFADACSSGKSSTGLAPKRRQRVPSLCCGQTNVHSSWDGRKFARTGAGVPPFVPGSPSVYRARRHSHNTSQRQERVLAVTPDPAGINDTTDGPEEARPCWLALSWVMLHALASAGFVKPWCTTRDVCVIEREQRNVIFRPQNRVVRKQPSNSKETKPSLGQIERRGSVRSTEKVRNSRVVPTQVPSAVSRFRHGASVRDDLTNYCNLVDQIQRKNHRDGKKYRTVCGARHRKQVAIQSTAFSHSRMDYTPSDPRSRLTVR